MASVQSVQIVLTITVLMQVSKKVCSWKQDFKLSPSEYKHFWLYSDGEILQCIWQTKPFFVLSGNYDQSVCL